jgi:hypothetical protein
MRQAGYLFTLQAGGRHAFKRDCARCPSFENLFLEDESPDEEPLKLKVIFGYSMWA